MTYAEYENLIDSLLAEGRTTGTDWSASKVGFTRLNRARMLRLDKTVEVDAAASAVLRNTDRPMIWLTLTEGWCGDAAQNIPVIEKIAAESDNIETRYLLRDENPGLMDLFLTNGARSIPKLIALDAETLEVLGTWGSRPAVAQQLFTGLKAEGVEKAAILEHIQRWYNGDRGKSLQEEFAVLIGIWSRELALAAT